MSDSASSPSEREPLLSSVTAEDFGLEFRVVARGGIRRGIRLERAFWISLKQMAESRKCTIGMLIDEIAETQAKAGNLTSAIRVACLRGLGEENQTLQRLVSIDTVNTILFACPSPAFAFASSRKILNFNAPFGQLLRRQSPLGDYAHYDLNLMLDLNVAEIFMKLDANGGMPVTTGFVIGHGERRYRGQLNAMRAPVFKSELLMAFVSGV